MPAFKAHEELIRTYNTQVQSYEIPLNIFDKKEIDTKNLRNQIQKVSVFGVILRIQSKCGKMRTRITPNMDTFYAVVLLNISPPLI